jgi:tetratricopeptide (TPR) repeat protein
MSTERFLSLSGEGGPMSATAEKNFSITRVDQLEPAATLRGTADGRQRFDVRRHLGITAFGIQAFSAPSGGRVISEHTETLLGEQGQQELYIVVSGAATFEIDGESVEAPTGALLHIQPSARRTATATEDGTTILVVGGTPGEAYKPAPEEAGEAFAAYNAGDYETAWAKQRLALEKQPDSAVAHFNAGCFAARSRHADEAIDHLRKAVELNERVKELMAGDEDLYSIRDDPRFAELASS